MGINIIMVVCIGIVFIVESIGTVSSLNESSVDFASAFILAFVYLKFAIIIGECVY